MPKRAAAASVSECPNDQCSNHVAPSGQWFHRHGTYWPKASSKPVLRYKCVACGKVFSKRGARPDSGQKRPDINIPLFKLLVSGVSMRRAALLLEVDYNTVLRHLGILARRAQAEHLKVLKDIKTTYIQIDELETFLHARAKPLSVPMVVRPKTGQILAFTVARMPSKGRLAAYGSAVYKWTLDERPQQFKAMLSDIKSSLDDHVTIRADANPSYPNWIRSILPNAQIEQSPGVKGKASSAAGKPFDDLFAINNAFARMRHDLNRLGRKTWSTTKSVDGLVKHIWLYVAWNNGYRMFAT